MKTTACALLVMATALWLPPDAKAQTKRPPVVGIDHVGLGPDFIDDYYQQVYGGWVLPADFPKPSGHAEVSRPSDLPRITDALVRRGFAEADIRKVLGDNVLRVMREVMGRPLAGS